MLKQQVVWLHSETGCCVLALEPFWHFHTHLLKKLSCCYFPVSKIMANGNEMFLIWPPATLPSSYTYPLQKSKSGSNPNGSTQPTNQQPLRHLRQTPPEPIQFAPFLSCEHYPRPPPYDVEKRRTILINYHLKLESIITSVGLYSPFGWPTGCCAALHLPWAGQSIREESVKISEIFIHHRLYNNSNNLLGWLFFEKRYDNDE